MHQRHHDSTMGGVLGGSEWRARRRALLSVSCGSWRGWELGWEAGLAGGRDDGRSCNGEWTPRGAPRECSVCTAPVECQAAASYAPGACGENPHAFYCTVVGEKQRFERLSFCVLCVCVYVCVCVCVGLFAGRLAPCRRRRVPLWLRVRLREVCESRNPYRRCARHWYRQFSVAQVTDPEARGSTRYCMQF